MTGTETFFAVQADDLKNDNSGHYKSGQQPKQKITLPMMPAKVPLVSVLIRSMDLPTLKAALDSVAVQTYSNIEVVVINAKGEEHSVLGDLCGRFSLRLIGGEGPLKRSRAANLGMENAHGEYLLFLDDDDLLLPAHLAKLTTALLDGEVRAAYTGVNLVDKDGSTILVLDEPWELARLRGANFLPVHAVIFDRSLVALGCSFNETLDCMEDWEFWLQISQHTAFRHVPGVSAIYRIAFGTSGLSQEADAEKHIVNRTAIFQAWLPRFTSRQWVETIYWFETARNQFMHVASTSLAENLQLSEKLAEANQRLSKTQNDVSKLRYQLSKRINKLVETSSHAKEATGQLTETCHQLAERSNQLRIITGQYAEERKEIDLLKQTIQINSIHSALLQQTIEALVKSTSWKVTGPLRFISRLMRGQHRQAFDGLRRRVHLLGRSVYFQLPPPWRKPLVETCFRLGGNLFKGLRSYEIWRQQGQHANKHFSRLQNEAMAHMVNISDIAPLTQAPPGRIGIHAHIFYPDLVEEFAASLRNVPFPYDLFVSVPSNEVREICQTFFKPLPCLNWLKIVVVANRGRDIAPMFCTFGDTLRDYDFIAHIHGKKSLYNNGATTGWREYLLKGLLGSDLQIRRIFTLLTASTGFGFVYPQNFSQLPYQANTWLSNRTMGRHLCQRLGISHVPGGYFDFPAGSMFWARSDSLKPLFDAKLRLEEFPEESGQKDATVAHCIERMFVLTANQSGFSAGIIRDHLTPRWSSWGFDVYLSRSRQYVESIISDAQVRVVIFDIFDTLLVRPFLDPECIKSIVAKQAGGRLVSSYRDLRVQAEIVARQRAGRDVGLDAIFEEFALQSKLPADTVARLRKMEETAESNAVIPRPDVVSLLRHALAQGKKVVLASDMYLPKLTIEAILARHSIDGWHALYLSSDIGWRKDSGDLYRYILDQEGLAPTQVLVIGDNEHSDSQIPGDMGMNICHVLRPVELARAVPRLGQLVDHALLENDLNEQITLGLIARTNFHPVFYHQFDPFAFVPSSPSAIGYSVLGPMVLSFIQWLSQTAAADGVQRLYFLSREGQFLKIIYDCWRTQHPEAPPSDYLVLSRRAVTVPIITDIEGIHAIAKTRYFPNQVADFIHERFGVELNEEEWANIWSQGVWRKNQLVEVVDGQIEHLEPLLLALQHRIFDQGKKELPALLAYLNRMGLNQEGKFALVDVGYAATIQARLNRLLNRPIHGYYMITDKRAETVASQNEVIAQGCFGNYVGPDDEAFVLLVNSFPLEKLLSSDDAQIIRYKFGSGGEILSELRGLSKEELHTRAVRAEIRNGAMDFVNHAIKVRSELLHDFIVPPLLARAIYQAFINCPAESEETILQELVLDDYYCGRGLVS